MKRREAIMAIAGLAATGGVVSAKKKSVKDRSQKKKAVKTKHCGHPTNVRCKCPPPKLKKISPKRSKNTMHTVKLTYFKKTGNTSFYLYRSGCRSSNL